jgi:outer membrane lipoprotein-sorting protein
MTTALIMALLLAGPAPAWAQTADEVLEKSLTAIGGRAALMKLKSRSMAGSIALSTPAGEVQGTIEILNAAPNKIRTLINVDLSSLGAGQLTIDQRFNGTAGYVMDSLQGNRDMSGGQLDTMRNSSFPHPFLNYKELGTTARVGGNEKVGDRQAVVIIFEPTTGPVVRTYIDAETYLPLRSVLKVDVPQLGQEVEQSTDFSDYRVVDGVKLPFVLKSSSQVQNYTITLTKVEHNASIDQSLFSKPAQ